jgi:prefoldin alpha subunit
MNENEKKAQELYVEYQSLEQKIKHLQKQIELLTGQLVDANSTGRSLDEFKNLKEGSEILFPLTSGIFAKAELKGTTELLVNVGAGTVVSKDVPSAKKLISGQIMEMEKVHKRMADELNKTIERAGHIEAQLQKLVAEK